MSSEEEQTIPRTCFETVRIIRIVVDGELRSFRITPQLPTESLRRIRHILMIQRDGIMRVVCATTRLEAENANAL